jgi:hypothetical protein
MIREFERFERLGGYWNLDRECLTVVLARKEPLVDGGVFIGM